MLAQEPFCFRLGQAERERKWACDRGEIDLRDLFLAMMERQTMQAVAGGEKALGQAHRLERFEGAWENRERLGILGTLRGVIDNPAADPMARQFVSHR